MTNRGYASKPSLEWYCECGTSQIDFVRIRDLIYECPGCDRVYDFSKESPQSVLEVREK